MWRDGRWQNFRPWETEETVEKAANNKFSISPSFRFYFAEDKCKSLCVFPFPTIKANGRITKTEIIQFYFIWNNLSISRLFVKKTRYRRKFTTNPTLLIKLRLVWLYCAFMILLSMLLSQLAERSIDMELENSKNAISSFFEKRRNSRQRGLFLSSRFSVRLLRQKLLSVFELTGPIIYSYRWRLFYTMQIDRDFPLSNVYQ